MVELNKNINEEIIIEKDRGEKMLQRLILLEKENIKTKKYSDQQIIIKIKKIIEEGVKCY